MTNIVCKPDLDNPGWHIWRTVTAAGFNQAVLGKIIVRAESTNSARMRLFPQSFLHTNAAGNIHGAIILALADVSLFSALHLLNGIDAGRCSTLDLQCQFITPGDAEQPLDSVVEVLRETRRLAFVRGLIMQGDVITASFTATARKPVSAS